jgi:chromosome segregation ATPase
MGDLIAQVSRVKGQVEAADKQVKALRRGKRTLVAHTDKAGEECNAARKELAKKQSGAFDRPNRSESPETVFDLPRRCEKRDTLTAGYDHHCGESQVDDEYCGATWSEIVGPDGFLKHFQKQLFGPGRETTVATIRCAPSDSGEAATLKKAWTAEDQIYDEVMTRVKERVESGEDEMARVDRMLTTERGDQQKLQESLNRQKPEIEGLSKRLIDKKQMTVEQSVEKQKLEDKVEYIAEQNEKRRKLLFNYRENLEQEKEDLTLLRAQINAAKGMLSSAQYESSVGRARASQFHEALIDLGRVLSSQPVSGMGKR